MSEGKPTKAKWWSRPRPPVAPGDEGGSPEGERISDGGDFELARPLEGGDLPAPPGSDAVGDAAGDFELDAPAPRGQESAVHGGAGAGSDGGSAGPGPDAGADGDFELAGPAPAHPGGEPDGISADRPPEFSTGPVSDPGADLPSESSGTPVSAAPASDPAADRPPEFSTHRDSAPSVGGPPEFPDHRAPVPSAAHPSEFTAAQALTDHPQPLHAPDPYGTPPYGEPGPWASAPPVQYPAATPARGTHVPAAHPEAAAHDTYAAPAEGPVSTPWQNYDPWAAPGPLQQNGAAVATTAQRHRRTNKALVLGAVLIALVSGGVGGAVGVHLERNAGESDVELPQAGKEAPGRAPDSVAGIAAQALPSVVTLHVSGSEEEATGTGFVLDGQGHILTNNHVVEPAVGSGEITVTFSGGDTAKAEVVGRDSGYDLAVVQVSGVRGLEPMPLGNSDSVQVGDPVVAIGAPFDLANTVTSGIISAKERPITAGGESGDGSDVSYVDALQTDAPINPGNSGGPLLDSRARAIGINSAIRSADSGSGLDGGQSGSIGLGFAIPINQGKRVAEELINTGRATHPVIGVTLDMDYTGDGAKVGTQSGDGGPAVTAGGPGARAGIEPGDIITEVDGRPVHSGEELIVKTRAHRPGDTLRLTLLRGGSEKLITLVLGSADSN
ncbi:trypsin-like peptidase domain-containing protein [Streptomyces sp. NPDC050535]|uniref:S1C family serine protease n=1 Tax=Streptomyces sp. NPDC050535 TaxID=3365626 RepID=UPI0037936C7F